jgi:hypothetical protein
VSGRSLHCAAECDRNQRRLRVPEPARESTPESVSCSRPVRPRCPSCLVRPRRVGSGRVGPRGGGGTCGHCKRERESEDGHGDADRQDVRPGRWASFHRSLLSIVRNGRAVQHTDSFPGPRNPRVSVRSRGPYRGTHAHSSASAGVRRPGRPRGAIFCRLPPTVRFRGFSRVDMPLGVRGLVEGRGRAPWAPRPVRARRLSATRIAPRDRTCFQVPPAGRPIEPARRQKPPFPGAFSLGRTERCANRLIAAPPLSLVV